MADEEPDAALEIVDDRHGRASTSGTIWLAGVIRRFVQNCTLSRLVTPNSAGTTARVPAANGECGCELGVLPAYSQQTGQQTTAPQTGGHSEV